MLNVLADGSGKTDGSSKEGNEQQSGAMIEMLAVKERHPSGDLVSLKSGELWVRQWREKPV